ncbi:MAG: HlyD family efflux transporter periplasmic adaptor subunit [Planctomycetes bacterium]|nr:HlyD family efflux transporter periplasmic adaptor subunit [Planctomycetota bacterium]
MSAVAAPPKLRSDLVINRQETPEGPRFVVKDPRKGTFFRLRQEEYDIVRRLDGATPVETVAAVAGRKSAELAMFVEQLERRGLLESAAQQASANERRPIFRGTLLWLRLGAFDPDRLLNRLVGKVRFCFTPTFVVGGLLLMLWALSAAFQYGAEISEDLSLLWRLDSLFLIWVTILGVTTIHEFAHGLTCKHFGGEVHEMGFLLIYFQPAFYCNISDAYLFPQKSRRLWVTAAGAYIDLFMWALATLAWRVLERGTWISGLALIVMATCGIRTFFNLNPLIKLDGYYLLTDLLAMPNLRPRAFGWIFAQLRRCVGLSSEVPDASPRERRIFLVYGLLALAFTYWLLTEVLFALGRYLTWHFQGWGFAMITGLTMATFLPRWRLPRKWRLLILGGVLVTLLGFLQVPFTVAGDTELFPGDNADLRAGIEGVIEEVYVDEGAVVQAGAPVARVSDRCFRTRRAVADAQIAEHEARLRQLKAGARPEELEIARVILRRSEDDQAQARVDLRRIRSLVSSGVGAPVELERAEHAATLRERQAQEAKARLALLEAGSRPEEIAAVEQQIARVRSERAQLDGDIARAVVRTPHAGVITTPYLRERVGEFVKEGDLIAEVHQIETLKAEVAVPEREIGAVRLGMPASIRFRAFPERTFTGTVTAIAPAAGSRVAPGAPAVVSTSRDGRTVRVTIEVKNENGLLKPNLTGYARIDSGERNALDVLTRRIRRFVRLEFWSWW